MERTWSSYQNGVFDFVRSGTGNAFVRAGPGSGKTTVIEEAVRRCPPTSRILAVSFNTHIRDELKKRFEFLPHVTVDTLNGFGNKLIRPNVGYRRINEDNLKSKTGDCYFFDVIGGTKASPERKKLYYKTKHLMKRVVGLLKAQMMWDESVTHEKMMQMLSDYGIDLPDMAELGESNEWFTSTAFWIMRHGFDDTRRIDFDDQIAWPIFHNWEMPAFDYIFVDEEQDMNPVQIEMIFRLLKNGGRGILVGDPHQAIYQFRGADKRAVETVIERLACVVLPLSICYRCSAAVVAEALRVYPDIEPHVNAVPGSVETIESPAFRAEVEPRNLVLCRTTAPLVSECLALIAMNKRAFIKGREFGEEIKELLPESILSVREFIDWLGETLEPKILMLQEAGRDDKALMLEDKMDCLIALCEGCNNTADIANRIDELFVKDGDGIALMTVHKSKGLEAERVFIIRPDLMPHPKSRDHEAETNIRWVAVTRAKVDLRYVNPPKRK